MTAVDVDPGELDAAGGLITEQRMRPELDVRTPDRRHPVEVTTVRLSDHVEAYGRSLTPDEVDDLARAVEVLDTLRTRLDAAARRRAQRGES